MSIPLPQILYKSANVLVMILHARYLQYTSQLVRALWLVSLASAIRYVAQAAFAIYRQVKI